MREYRKQLEVKEAVEQAVLQAARRGEPMDPEMFNPARKRPYIQVRIIKILQPSKKIEP